MLVVRLRSPSGAETTVTTSEPSSVTVDKDGTVSIIPVPSGKNGAPSPIGTSGQIQSRIGKPESAAKTLPVRENPLLPKIVFGEWMPLLPPRGQMLGWDRSKECARYADVGTEKRDKDWIPLLTSPDQLVGWTFWGSGPFVYSDGTIELGPGSNGGFYQVSVNDASLRAHVKKSTGQCLYLKIRHSKEGDYWAWFNGGNAFGVHKMVDGRRVQMGTAFAPQSYRDFFDFRFTAVGDSLTVFANDQLLMHLHDTAHSAGYVGIGALGAGSFRDISVFIPNRSSLVADNRLLSGPFADVAAVDEICTRCLSKEPDNLPLYLQRAELRARYEQKWQQAADDLAKAIELNPDDFDSWHHRTMLLVKLQQKELLAAHLSKMLARFQDDPSNARMRSLIHGLTAFPIGRPELIETGELIADKLPNNGDFQFWKALADYRAGKYQEAEALVATADVRAEIEGLFATWVRYMRPIFEAFHAMNKAKLGDPRKASELLSKAKADFKEVFGDQAAARGDYGEKWWDRLCTEALLAEAEGVIAGTKPANRAAEPVEEPVALGDFFKDVPGRWVPVLRSEKDLAGCDIVKATSGTALVFHDNLLELKTVAIVLSSFKGSIQGIRAKVKVVGHRAGLKTPNRRRRRSFRGLYGRRCNRVSRHA